MREGCNNLCPSPFSSIYEIYCSRLKDSRNLVLHCFTESLGLKVAFVFLLFLLALILETPKSFTGKGMPEWEQQGEANSWSQQIISLDQGKSPDIQYPKLARNISESHTSNSLASFLRCLRCVRRSCQNEACKERGRLRMKWKKTSIFQGMDTFCFLAMHTFLMKEFEKQTNYDRSESQPPKQMFLWQLQPQADLLQQKLPGIQGVVLLHCCM